MQLHRLRAIACFPLVLIASTAGCGDDTTNHNVGGATPSTSNVTSSTGRATSAPTATVTASSSTISTSSVTAGSSSSGTQPEPCIPPQDADRAPTAGACAGNVAKVCDPQTSTMTEIACGVGEVCEEYPLVRHLFSQATQQLEEAASFVWAGCVPVAPIPCELAFHGSGWTSTYPVHCDGSDKIWCDTPPTPFFPSAMFLSGTPDGYVHEMPCEPGKICRAPTSGDVQSSDALGCFDPNAASCIGTTTRCDGDTAYYCAEAFGYEVEADCALEGKICMTGCNASGGCVPADTQACDPAAQPITCETTDSYLWCTPQCLTRREDCSTVPIFDPVVGVIDIPGDCIVVDPGPTCLPEGTVPCDSSAPEVCDGDVARRCVGGVPRDQQCKSGDVCIVGANGKAGCTFAGALPCAPDAPRACDMTVLHGCCDADGQLFVSNYLCAPGFEATFDCASLSGWACVDDDIFWPAHCDSL